MTDILYISYCIQYKFDTYMPVAAWSGMCSAPTAPTEHRPRSQPVPVRTGLPLLDQSGSGKHLKLTCARAPQQLNLRHIILHIIHI